MTGLATRLARLERVAPVPSAGVPDVGPETFRQQEWVTRFCAADPANLAAYAVVLERLMAVGVACGYDESRRMAEWRAAVEADRKLQALDARLDESARAYQEAAGDPWPDAAVA